jgi:hypothetical protein
MRESYAYKFDPPFIRYGLQLLFVFADLVADDTTDRRAADSSDCAATRKHGTTHGADAGANRSILVLRRHPAAATHTEQHRCADRSDRTPVHRFHGDTSFPNSVIKSASEAPLCA